MFLQSASCYGQVWGDVGCTATFLLQVIKMSFNKQF